MSTNINHEIVVRLRALAHMNYAGTDAHPASKSPISEVEIVGQMFLIQECARYAVTGEIGVGMLDYMMVHGIRDPKEVGAHIAAPAVNLAARYARAKLYRQQIEAAATVDDLPTWEELEQIGAYNPKDHGYS